MLAFTIIGIIFVSILITLGLAMLWLIYEEEYPSGFRSAQTTKSLRKLRDKIDRRLAELED